MLGLAGEHICSGILENLGVSGGAGLSGVYVLDLDAFEDWVVVVLLRCKFCVLDS